MEWSDLAVIAVIVVIVIVAVAVVSFIVGFLDANFNAPPAQPGSADPCVDCNNYNNWYKGLEGWRRAAELAYYLAQSAVCSGKGCPFK